ncbi:hypothetical protein ACFSX9_07140 [Flavobacterium ardleyense]|uniref:Uncharacterized protein n=1 Tax=Flavobacterium ardleyense TaxID=2038737 RepID=A0ABW5Z8U5_9FLAO
MKKFYLVFILVLTTEFVHAQFFKDNVYYEGEVGAITSFLVKDEDGNSKIISLGGLSFRGGLGIHNEEESLFFGLHTGIEGNFRHKTGILPIYFDSKVAFDIGENTKLIFSFGYGKSFQVGPENYKGFLRKYTIARKYYSKG